MVLELNVGPMTTGTGPAGFVYCSRQGKAARKRYALVVFHPFFVVE